MCVQVQITAMFLLGSVQGFITVVKISWSKHLEVSLFFLVVIKDILHNETGMASFYVDSMLLFRLNGNHFFSFPRRQDPRLGMLAAARASASQCTVMSGFIYR